MRPSKWFIQLIGSTRFWMTALAFVVATGFSLMWLQGETFELNLENGEALYAAHCASCHGASLEGEENWKSIGEDGLLPAPPHDATGHTWHHSDRLLFSITKEGSEVVIGNGYKSNMPGFGSVLSDDEISDVLGFIKSSWPVREREFQEYISEQDDG